MLPQALSKTVSSGGCQHSLARGPITPISASVATLPPPFLCLLFCLPQTSSAFPLYVLVIGVRTHEDTPE